MPNSLSTVCLLLASFHSCLPNKQSHDGEKDTPEIAISCSKGLQNLEILSTFSEIAVGRNVTLECRSQKGCLPINYTLYLNAKKMQHIIQRKAEEKVVFNITINSIGDIGEYKCKAQNNGSKYSPGFNFTLRDTPEIAISCSKGLQNVEIGSPFSEIAIGRNVTLECRSQKGCLPISYTLFLNAKKMQHIIQRKAEEKVVFNITINSISDIGEYKCKAQNSGSKYSPGFNFTLREAPEEEKNKLVVYIIAPLLLLFLLAVIAVAIPLMILPWCKAKNQKSASTSTRFTPVRCLNSETCPTYDVAYGKGEEVVYCNVKTETMEKECRKGTLTEDTTVDYAEIVITR